MEDGEESTQLAAIDRLSEGDEHAPISVGSQVDPLSIRGSENLLALAGSLEIDPDRVEEGLIGHPEAERAQARGKHLRKEVNPAGDMPEAIRPVVYRVHGCHHGEQHLRGANVRRGLVATDVLLAGLQGEAIGRAAVGIPGNADETSWKEPLVLIPAREKCRVGSTKTHGHTEPLG
jgi:hypothetical protein